MVYTDINLNNSAHQPMTTAGQMRGWEIEKFTHRSFSLSLSFCRLDLCSSPIRMTAARMPAFLEFTLGSVSDMLFGPHSKTDLGPGPSWAVLVWPSSLPLAEGLRIYISVYLSPSLLLSLAHTPILIACSCLDLIGGVKHKPLPCLTSPSLSISLSLFATLTDSYSRSQCLPLPWSDRWSRTQAPPTPHKPLPLNSSLTFQSFSICCVSGLLCFLLPAFFCTCWV